MNTKNIITPVDHNETQGFTLIELLFATIILGVMLTMTITTFIGVFRFYTWAGTTRVNQQNARQIMDDISRLIASRKVNTNTPASTRKPDGTYSSLCFYGEGQESIKISLNYGNFLTNKVTVDRYAETENDCVGQLISRGEISDNINTKVTKLEFVVVYGALNNSIYSNSDPDIQANLKKSVEFTIDVINGTPSQGTDNCMVGDNFCDKASYTSAVSER